jgi:hypothetical protein
MIFCHIVTKKRGSDYVQQHTDCLQQTLVHSSDPDLPHTYKSPIFLTLKPLTDSFHALQTKTCANSNKTNPTTFISCLICSHKCHLKKHCHSHFRLCTSPIAQALPLSKYSQKHQVQRSSSLSISLSTCFYDCSAATVRLIARRSGKFWHSAKIS